MFYDTYPLVSEYCPGCGQHEGVVFDEEERFPLLAQVKGFGKSLSAEMEDFFSETNEALIITRDKRRVLIDHYKPDLVVCESKDGYGEAIKPDLIYLNYKELRTLLKYDAGFFVAGLIMAIYSEDQSKAMDEYNIMRKCVKKGNKILHVTGSDFLISKSSDKTISLDVDGKVVG